MEFKIKDGRELSIDLQQWEKNPNYTTTIVEERELEYQLMDESGFIVNFPKELLAINSIQPAKDKVILSESLYNHHLGKKIKVRNERGMHIIEIDLLRDFTKIIAHKDLIFNSPEYFLIRINALNCGDTIGGGFNFCLGGLLENWFTTDDLLIRNHFAEGDLYIAQLGGSCLSGSYSGLFWSMEKNQFFLQNSKNPPYLGLPEGGLHKWISKLKNIARLYPYRIGKNDEAIKKLIHEIQN